VPRLFDVGMRENKAQLRDVLRRRRAAIGAHEREKWSHALCRAVKDDPTWRAATVIAAFVGVAEEPDTRPLLEDALAQDKTLWVPRVVDGASGRSEIVRIDDLDILAPAGFGLLEPRRHAEEVVAPAILAAMSIDLVLVPGLGFARNGARLGHGPGHYDRLLAPIRDVRPPTRIGVCFTAMLDPSEGTIPIEPHDVLMHRIATEDGIVDCDPA
jgi:5-formyltetrahydrofolate cyclo-ligase